MTKIIIVLIAFFSIGDLYSQNLVATIEFKEPIDGFCTETVYALMDGFDGQKEARTSVSEEEIINYLKANFQYIKDNPKAKFSGSITYAVNCNGELLKVDCSIYKNHKEAEKELLALASKYTKWIPGFFDGRPVDSQKMIGFSVKKGVLE